MIINGFSLKLQAYLRFSGRFLLCDNFSILPAESFVIAFVFSIKPTIFHRRRLLTVTPGDLVYAQKLSAPPVTFSKADIESFRYAIDGLRGYVFWIGRIYRIEIRNHKGKVIRVKLWSLYGIRSKKLAEKYSNILNAVYKQYFNDMAIHYANLLDNQLSFTLAGVGLSPDGVADLKMGCIPWNRICVKSYHHYFALYDIQNAGNYRTFEYGLDWNSSVLYAVVQHAVRKQSQQMVSQQ